MNILRKQKGITLIALVITIIILIILAGISINLIFGENGIIARAVEQQEKQDIARILEKLEIQKGTVGIDNQNIIKLEKYLDYIKSKELIKQEDIVENTGNCALIIMEEKYVYLLEEEENGNLKITYYGKIDNLKPIIELKNITNTTNSITVEIATKRNNGGNIEYYLKKEEETEYKLQKTTQDTTYTYESLEQNQKYNIKMIAVTLKGKTAEITADRTTIGVTGLTTANTTFSYEPIGWTNGTVTVTANTTVKGYTLQTSKDGINWETKSSQTFNENGKMLARVVDSTNQATEYVVFNVENIDTTKPIMSNFTYTKTTNSIDITAEGLDEQSGIIRYQFSNDNGTSWTEIQESNKYTFSNLASGSYEVKVRVYNGTYVNGTIDNYLDSAAKTIKTTIASSGISWINSSAIYSNPAQSYGNLAFSLKSNVFNGSTTTSVTVNCSYTLTTNGSWNGDYYSGITSSASLYNTSGKCLGTISLINRTTTVGGFSQAGSATFNISSVSVSDKQLIYIVVSGNLKNYNDYGAISVSSASYKHLESDPQNVETTANISWVNSSANYSNSQQTYGSSNFSLRSNTIDCSKATSLTLVGTYTLTTDGSWNGDNYSGVTSTATLYNASGKVLQTAAFVNRTTTVGGFTEIGSSIFNLAALSQEDKKSVYIIITGTLKNYNDYGSISVSSSSYTYYI